MNKYTKAIIIALIAGLCAFTFKNFQNHFTNKKEYAEKYAKIEEFIIDRRFDGDRKKHEAAKKSGDVTYCKKYVKVFTGIKGTSHQSYSYYRISDGRLYCYGGAYCFVGTDQPENGINYLETPSEENPPLTCTCPPPILTCPTG